GARMAVAPLAGHATAAFFAELVQQEIGEAVAGVLSDAVFEESQRSIVAGVVAVLLHADYLETGLQDVDAAHDRQIISDLVFVLHGFADGRARTDIGQSVGHADLARACDGPAAGNA